MEHLERVLDKLDKLDDRLDKLDLTLVRNTISLEEHSRRCDLLEKDLKPVKKHVLIIETSFKLIGALSVVIAIVAGLCEIFK